MAIAEIETSIATAVEIVVPVRDEARVLETSIRRLHDYLSRSFPFGFRITIADNGSTDGTWDIATVLAFELDEVQAVRVDRPGRGGALQAVWSESDATVLAYMDVDLSTDLAALLPLIAPLVTGHSDLAIGSRLTRGARVVRGPKRELISRAYNTLLRTVLGVRFSDAQCGFKAIRADRARELLPLVKDRGWFFDTELLVVAERHGLRIHEVPVDWVDDPDSRVDIVATAIGDLRGVARLVRFGVIGIVSTLAYLALYDALRIALAALAANAIALLATAIGNTAANRRFTFSIRGGNATRHQLKGLVVFGAALAITSGSLWVLHASDPHASRAAELAVLVAANLFATVVRFTFLRGWVFAEARR
jgi:glycosyltransferase involved in cell wall biosynthesis